MKNLILIALTGLAVTTYDPNALTIYETKKNTFTRKIVETKDGDTLKTVITESYDESKLELETQVRMLQRRYDSVIATNQLREQQILVPLNEAKRKLAILNNE